MRKGEAETGKRVSKEQNGHGLREPSTCSQPLCSFPYRNGRKIHKPEQKRQWAGNIRAVGFPAVLILTVKAGSHSDPETLGLFIYTKQLC